MCNNPDSSSRSDNITIVNNLLAGNYKQIWVSGGCAGEGSMVRSLVAGNTLVNAYNDSIYLYETNGVNAISKFYNNIIYDSKNFSMIVGSNSGFEFSNNLWSNQPTFASNTIRSAVPMVGNPNLIGIGEIENIHRKQKMNPEWFKLQSNSPAINNGTNLGFEYSKDYFSSTRGADGKWDIGAVEYVSGTPLPPPVIPENCTNGIDDDGDEKIDCNDSGCFSNSNCQESTEGLCDGLKLLYHFDNNASDFSGNGNDGVVNGAVLTTGRFEKGYSFDGVDDFIKLQSLDLSESDKLTVSFWYKPNLIGITQILMELSENYNFVDYGFIIFLRPEKIIETSSKGQVGNSVWQSNSNLSSGSWYHIVGVFDRSLLSEEARGYVNGVSDGSLKGNSNNVNNFGDLPLFIGARNETAYFINGTIDEIAIWNRILNESEISSLSNSKIICRSETPTCTILLSHINQKMIDWRDRKCVLGDVIALIRQWVAEGKC